MCDICCNYDNLPKKKQLQSYTFFFNYTITSMLHVKNLIEMFGCHR